MKVHAWDVLNGSARCLNAPQCKQEDADDEIAILCAQGEMRFTDFPLADTTLEEFCETERHDGMRIPATFLFLMFTPDPVHHMRIYRYFAECGECAELKKN